MRTFRVPRWAAMLALASGIGLAGLPAGPGGGPALAATARPPAAWRASSTAAAPDYQRACAAARPGRAACLALVRTNVRQREQASLRPDAAPSGVGYGPASLHNAYQLPSGSAGTGETVAVVDVYDDPNAAADLATYRSDWGLPPCTGASGCFTKVNENGQASPLPQASGSTGWATEESLDLDMVSAVCPLCHILLVEANTPSITDLGTGVNSAVALGAAFVSNSYGASEYAGETSDDTTYYDHPGIVVTASAGDSGYGTSFPAASPSVVAVGGTSLTAATNARGWDETVWSGSGSGCSLIEPKPSWQTDAGCANRTDNDVAAVADPNTGVAVYDSYDRGGWLEVGGTSVGSPLIASVFALAGKPKPSTYPASYPYAHSTSLNDVTSGNDGDCYPDYLCAAGPGFDGPTGWGTPDGITAFTAPAGNIVTVTNPGSQTATADVAFSLQSGAADSAAGQTLTFSAVGLPPGLSITPAAGLISGTPTKVGAYTVTVTVADTTGATGTATFPLTVNSPVSLSGPGPQAGYLGEPAVHVAVMATDAVPGRTLTFSAASLPPGVSIDPASGIITGMPTAAGYYHPTITATDSTGRTGSQSVVWYLAPAQVSGHPGPVELGGARICLAAGGFADGTAVRASRCHRASFQAWSVQPGGTVQAGGKCLTVADAGAAGSPVQISACAGSAAQQWRIGADGELVNPGSGNCLNDPGGVAGTAVDVAACAAGAGQRWAVPAGPIVSGETGKCADTGAGTTGHVQVWYCGDTTAQAWGLQPDGTLRADRACLTITARHTGSGDEVTLARCAGSATQQWQPAAGGAIVNPHTGTCLADPGDNPTTGTPLVATACDNSTGQQWHIE